MKNFLRQSLAAIFIVMCIFSATVVRADNLQQYTQEIQLNPNYAKAYYNRGLAYQALGDNEKAQADFASAEQLGYNV